MRKSVLLSLVVLVLITPGLSPGSPAPNAETVSYEQNRARMAAVRIKNWISGYQQPGPLVTGSGTLAAIDGREALVLTAAHLFEGKVGPISVEFTDGQLSGTSILAIDQKLDLAALWMYAPKEIEPVPLAQHDPAIGQQVEIWGFGPRRFRSFLAEVSLPIPAKGDVPSALVAAEGVEDRQVTIPGDSGGPMISQGKLVGVHWGYRAINGTRRRCVHAVGCNTMRRLAQDQALARSVARAAHRSTIDARGAFAGAKRTA